MTIGFRDETSLSNNELIEEIKELREILRRRCEAATQQSYIIEDLRAQVRRTYAVVNDYVPIIEDEYDR